MITVKIVRDQDRIITGMFVSGHAGYAPEGEDIVCAGASTLIYTLVNSLERVCGVDAASVSVINDDGASVSAEVIIPKDERSQTVAETIVTGYMSLASSVNGDGMQYIMIREEN